MRSTIKRCIHLWQPRLVNVWWANRRKKRYVPIWLTDETSKEEPSSTISYTSLINRWLRRAVRAFWADCDIGYISYWNKQHTEWNDEDACSVNSSYYTVTTHQLVVANLGQSFGEDGVWGNWSIWQHSHWASGSDRKKILDYEIGRTQQRPIVKLVSQEITNGMQDQSQCNWIKRLYVTLISTWSGG